MENKARKLIDWTKPLEFYDPENEHNVIDEEVRFIGKINGSHFGCPFVIQWQMTQQTYQYAEFDAYGTPYKNALLHIRNKRVKKQGFINVYKDNYLGKPAFVRSYIYATKEEAIKAATLVKEFIVATAQPFEWEEN